jgi:hypothetical protein
VKSSVIAGINIQQPWAHQLLEGNKTIETRFYKIPAKYVGHPIALVETPGKGGKFKARIVGLIVFGPSTEYPNATAFNRDFKKHLVQFDHPTLGWSKERNKWAWPIIAVEKIDVPIPAPNPRGIVFCNGCKVPTRQLSSIFQKI